MRTIIESELADQWISFIDTYYDLMNNGKVECNHIGFRVQVFNAPDLKTSVHLVESGDKRYIEVFIRENLTDPMSWEEYRVDYS
jgi:hypothetical protein